MLQAHPAIISGLHRPLRLGHCVYYDDANLDRLRESGIAVEACLTCHQRVFRVPYAENIVGTLPWSQVTLATDNPAFLGSKHRARRRTGAKHKHSRGAE